MTSDYPYELFLSGDSCSVQRFNNDHFSSKGCPQTGTLRLGKLTIEFDETSQLQRVRFGTGSTEAVFAVLEAWLRSAEP